MEQQEVIGAERKKPVASYLVIKAEVPWYARYFSKYTKFVRMLAWIHRYRHNCAKKTERQVGDLSNHELARGELWLVRLVQADEFSDCKSPSFSILKQLKANQDGNGIWRVQTRIFMRRDTNLFRSPMLLPSTNKIVHLLIQKIHEKLSHGGIQVHEYHPRKVLVATSYENYQRGYPEVQEVSTIFC
ncbi:unnamed protein product [Allacma fusca]|uniref:Uncharacterized protein n=1 Tax=Allacma fusca TaxID=39272 RepID=A0A8J2L044_9HEXA|nr:unnamed protein product [Allacma fusca]